MQYSIYNTASDILYNKYYQLEPVLMLSTAGSTPTYRLRFIMQYSIHKYNTASDILYNKYYPLEPVIMLSTVGYTLKYRLRFIMQYAIHKYNTAI